MNQRGAHVRQRPEMQQRGRDGQVHWRTNVKKLRERCAERDSPLPEVFQEQISRCSRSGAKPQKECVLRFLQLAAMDGLLTPLPFSAEGGFFGWTGFEVVRSRSRDLAGALQDLIPRGAKEGTLRATFRRAKLVPEENNKWRKAWEGSVKFISRA